MASTGKEDGTAAGAARQLGSMSLGESVERKGEPETKNEDDTNGTPTKLCSACGEKSDTLKKCTACKCVWYCDKECQNKHRKEHKHECKPIKKELAKRGGKLDLGTEEDLGPLPDLPPREECPICMRPMPIHQEHLRMFAVCCHKALCDGCVFQHDIKQTSGRWTCAFCRTAAPAETDEEILARTRKRVECKDKNALSCMALWYGEGEHGLPVDQAKCTDLLRESAGLGDPLAHLKLGTFYHNGEMGLKKDDEKARIHWEKAAESGYLIARHHLGCAEAINGDFVAAMRHWRLSASGGHRGSMDNLIECFENGDLHHSDLAETLQAMYLAKAELNSEGRDEYIKHLKKTGEYDKDYYEY